MNQNVLLTIAASVGLVAGAGGTWFATSTPVSCLWGREGRALSSLSVS